MFFNFLTLFNGPKIQSINDKPVSYQSMGSVDCIRRIENRIGNTGTEI